MFDLKVNNFRSFINQRFEFSRINILIGENSGGKSSLLKLLLALKQTIDSPTESNLKLSGDYTDLGNFEEVVYYKKKNKKIGLTFEAGEQYNTYFMESLPSFLSESVIKKEEDYIQELVGQYKDSKTQISFELNNKLDDHSSIKTVIKNSVLGKIELIQKTSKEEIPSRQIIVSLKINLVEFVDVIDNCAAFKEGFFTMLGGEFRTVCYQRFGNLGDKLFYQLAYLLVFQNFLVDEFNKIRFVNPIGTSPKRFYFKEDKKNSYKTIDIEKLINIFTDKGANKKSFNDRLELLNSTIKNFGIAEEIEIIQDKLLPVIALNVKTKDFWSNITDVGYGVSLQLPILFQAILSEHYTKQGQTLLIEQPEVHLHPKLQAQFIETLVSLGPKNSYFIETHSEHIVRKLQVLIKNKSFGLKPEDVSVHYFKREPLKFSITSHPINNEGRIKNPFPSGFYDTSYSLVKALM